jgi:uncharacterized protein
MQNALYTGFVIHNRISPKKHKFMYKIRMFFLDVDRLPNAFSKIPFISVDKFNLISFHRKNYLPSKKPTSIRHEVEKHLNLIWDTVTIL